jgi:hypothetical protein
LIGSAGINSEYGAWAVRPVPEPQAYVLLAVGIALVGLTVRKRRQAA